MHRDAGPGHQRHVLDQQGQHALALQRAGPAVVPHAGEVAGHVCDALASRRIELGLLVVLLALVLTLQVVELAQALVPVGFQCIGHQPVVRIHLGVAAARQLGFVACTLELHLPPRGGLLDALGDLVLHGQRDLDGRRRDRLLQ